MNPTMADPPNDVEIGKIREALEEGNKIKAIKVYREATGKGLKEAKDSIDALVLELKQKDPERYAKLSSGKGCTPVVVFGIGLVIALILFLL